MRRAVCVLIAAAGLAACGTSAASTSGPTSTHAGATTLARCGPAHAATLAATSSARVFLHDRTVGGCLAGSRRAVRLGGRGNCQLGAVVGTVAVGGRDAAAALSRCATDTASTTVEVIRLSDGRRLYGHAAIAVALPESFTDVSAIVVGGDGRTAWIAALHSIARHTAIVQVLAGGPGVPTRVLADSPRIGLHSLRLSGARVSWLIGATRHSAPLG